MKIINAQDKWAYIKATTAENTTLKGILINNGKELIRPIYQNIVFTNNIFYCKSENKWGCIDSTGKVIIEMKYEDIGFGLSEGLLKVKKEDKWGFIDITGKTVIDFEYDFVCNFENGEAYTIKDGKSMFISKDGKKIAITDKKRSYCPEDGEGAFSIQNQFETDTMIRVEQKDDKYGVVDTNSNEIIPIKYDEIGYYYNDIIIVKLGNLFGAYKNNGELIIEPKYAYIGLFNNWR